MLNVWGMLLLCEVSYYIKTLTMNFLYVIISPLRVRHIAWRIRLLWQECKEKETRFSFWLPNWPATSEIIVSTRRLLNMLSLLFQEAVWETSQSLQAIGATWASSICSWCRGSSLAVLVNAGWLFHQKLPEIAHVMPVLTDFTDTYLNGLIWTASSLFSSLSHSPF